MRKNKGVSPGSSESLAESASTLWGGTWDSGGGVLAGWGAETAGEESMGHLHGLILAVGAEVDCWTISEQNDDAVLPGIVLWWR